MQEQHELDLALCADLEHLADRLPLMADSAHLRRLCERILAARERWGDRRWANLFDPSPAWAARMTDAFHAEDVIEAIWAHWRNPSAANTGQLSYMLRALFDGRRRAVALEEALLGCAECQASASD